MYKKIPNYQLDLNRPFRTLPHEEVFLAMEQGSLQPRVVSVLSKAYLSSPFHFHQIKLAAQQYMSHKIMHKVPLVNVADTEICVYVVQQYYPQGALQLLYSKEKQPLTNTLILFRQLCLAVLSFVTEGVVIHGLTPASVFLDGANLKIRAFSMEYLLWPTFNQYSAPETILQNKTTGKSNVWSLGMIFFRMLFGINFNVSSKQQLIALLRQPINFPSDVDAVLVQFLRGCLQFNMELRFSWEQFYLHPIFSGFFLEYMKILNSAQSKLKYIVRKLKDSILRNNINIQTIFQMLNMGHDVSRPLFFQFLTNIDATLNQLQFNVIFEKIDQDKSGTISLSQIKQWLQKNEIKLSSFQTHVLSVPKLQIDPMEIQKIDQQTMNLLAMSLVEKVKNFLYANRVNLRSAFNMFSHSEEMNFEQYCQMIRLVVPAASMNELECSFRIFDWNKDRKISFGQFASTIQKMAGLPFSLI